MTLTFNGSNIELSNTEGSENMIQISLAAARVNAELNQEEAAKMLGVTAKTLRGYEQGKVAIPAITLRKAAKLYNIPEDMIRLPIVDDDKYDEEGENFLQPTTV